MTFFFVTSPWRSPKNDRLLIIDQKERFDCCVKFSGGAWIFLRLTGGWVIKVFSDAGEQIGLRMIDVRMISV